MKPIIDLHTHTIASGHAYNTMNEMIHTAKEKGLSLFGIADHGPKIPGSVSPLHFHNLKVCKREKYGLQVRYGAELNIVDFQGDIDLSEEALTYLDYTIASLHTPCIAKGSRRDYTNAYLGAMDNPHIDIIGHPDDGRFPYEMEAFVEKAAKTRKIIEVNNSSLLSDSFRQGGREMYEHLLPLCLQYRIPILIGSDAHVEEDIGRFDEALELLGQMNYSEELILNDSTEKLKKFLDERRGIC